MIRINFSANNLKVPRDSRIFILWLVENITTMIVGNFNPPKMVRISHCYVCCSFGITAVVLVNKIK